ncbi:complement C1q subcomponent subunit A [Centroberyx gerrardi]|uniref:complement C1q subcomponent subunit A-like n=1 Tax=Centroberyx gerrardi TaxID=166262 RepID=UPI003AADF6D9
MGGYYWLVALVGVASLLSSGQCSESCRGTDGHAGEAGGPGRDGWPGQKGEKGEPAVMPGGLMDAAVLMRLKGEAGNRGLQGIMGLKGYRGDVGPAGLPGRPGPPGPDDRGFSQHAESSRQARSAFSVVRNVSTYPAYNKKVTFQRTIINKPFEDLNLNTGIFTCRVPGSYYFVFHSMSKVSMCLYLMSDALVRDLGFCDYHTRKRDQVLSGGVVLQLTAGQKVWLQSFKDQQPDSVVSDRQDKQIIFNGFLLF